MSNGTWGLQRFPFLVHPERVAQGSAARPGPAYSATDSARDVVGILFSQNVTG
jgi:hypothetical protein